MQRKQTVDETAEAEAAADPMDTWLKQQLGGLHSDMLAEDLPDELGALAAALEARLRAAKDDDDEDTPAKPGSTTGGRS